MSLEDELEADSIHLSESTFSTGAPAYRPETAAPVNVNVPEPKPEAPKNTGAVENLIGRTIADVERDMILNTLEHCIGNRTHAANILGISIRTLRNKLAQYKDEGVDIPAASGG
jgi:two-component system response regulator FlrC